METLPDALREGLAVVSIGLNPSVPSARAGFPFANPRNRFWPALNDSGVVPEHLDPGPEAVQRLVDRYGVGFTDVVKRPTRGGGELRAADFRRDAPRLRAKLVEYRPGLAWFHGKQAYAAYLRYAEGVRPEGLDWGEQPRDIDGIPVFVTPNPSPANAAFSRADLEAWYRRLAAWLPGTQGQ